MSWRPIPSLPAHYLASSDGQIKRLACWYGSRRFRERILKANDDGKGYLVVTVIDGTAKVARVHKLVCETFHGPAPVGKPLVLHRDGNSKNNRADNLRWGTYEENEADKDGHGRRPRGERAANAKLTDAAVRAIRSSTEELSVLASRYGVTETAVSYARRGRTWKHVE